ncbi:CopG-like domain-containing protein DNA-binding [Thalassoporum mexicanum PCC 7367]|nr:CopG-like domain-containing protein DNA-binding [Pseudanabaena sp. PCC 7367]
MACQYQKEYFVFTKEVYSIYCYYYCNLTKLLVFVQVTVICSYQKGVMARTKPPSNKVMSIRLTESEFKQLEKYCIDKGKTKTEAIRNMIRRLRADRSAGS